MFSQHCWIWSKTRSLKASTVFSLSSLANFPSSLCRTQSPSCCNTNIRLAFVFFTAAQKISFCSLYTIKMSFSSYPPSSLVLFSSPPLHSVFTCECALVFVHISQHASHFQPQLSSGILGGLRWSRGSSIFKPACYPKGEDLRHKLICTWHVWVHWGPPNTSHLNKLQIEILM